MYDGRRMVLTSDKSTNAILWGSLRSIQVSARDNRPAAMSEMGQTLRANDHETSESEEFSLGA